MHIRRMGGVTRVDLQAAVLCCCLTVTTGAFVLAVSLMLPPPQALPVATGIIALFCVAAIVGSRVLFYNISNPSRRAFYNTDRLTGVKSRNAFEIDLQNIHASAHWRSAGLLLLDLDQLKAVNDAMGHTVGDEYLRLAAGVLRRESGEDLCPYRVGGDEFAVLAPDVDEAALEGLARRVLDRFDQEKPHWPVPISLSLGWACFGKAEDHNLYDTYRRADERMYEHKRRQRECPPG